MTLAQLITHWRDRAAREARQSIADAYLECARQAEQIIEIVASQVERLEASAEDHFVDANKMVKAEPPKGLIIGNKGPKVEEKTPPPPKPSKKKYTSNY